MDNKRDYHKEKYERRKKELLKDKSICKENKELFEKFFEWEEKKLKRMYGVGELDEGSYKTLDYYITKFRNVNNWFKNKAWVNLTKADIEKVYEDLEEGKIKNVRGERYGDLKSYYSKVFRSKPFEMAGKTALVKEVIEFPTRRNNEDVRFIEEATFRKLVSVMIRPDQKLLAWLHFDIGENINTLLNLSKKDFFKQQNPDSKDPEYMVNLPRKNIKRTRVTRSEITNYTETVELLDIVLKDKKDFDKVFNFEYRMASKFLARAVKITGVKCIPNGEPVTWKDLRSSMACDLLKKEWTTDQVNARLGHKPSSREIDKYVNFLAINRHQPKQKNYKFSVQKLENQIDEKSLELKFANEKIRRLQADQDAIKKEMLEMQKFMQKQIAKAKTA